jgi:hypothetical protein
VVKIDAMTLLGQFLKAGLKNKGTAGGVNGPGRGRKGENGSTKAEPPFSPAPTLADIGIGKKESADV